MGANLLNARNLRRAQAATGDELIDHLWVQSHHESGRYAQFVTSDHRHGWWDRRTGEYGYYEGDEVTHFSSCRRFL